MSDYTGCRIIQVLFLLTETLWDYKFMSDITGCRKTGVPLYLSIPNIKVCPKKFQFRQVSMYRFSSDKQF